MEPNMGYIAADHEAGPEASKSRGRKPNKGATAQKKKPQRGMGVAQLERLRLLERRKMMTEMSPMSSVVDHSFHFQPHYALALPEPIPSFQVMHGAVGACCAGGSGMYSPDLRVVQVGSGMSALVETSKELSSMPNMQHKWPMQVPHDRCDVCLKKKRFNGENMGFNGGKDKYAEISQFNHSDNILGFNQENNMNMNYFNGGINDFGARAARSAFYAGQSLNEGVEVRAIHKNGNTTGRSVFMEYEFFPGKGGRSSSSKELELPAAEVSAAVGGEASCFTTNAASNSVDLSLKLSY